MADAKKVRILGFNHIALEVGDIEEALAFYGGLFDFKLRSKNDSMAFIDLGDQFLALQKGRTQAADDGRHFGLVVDDKEAARKALLEAGVKTLPGVRESIEQKQWKLAQEQIVRVSGVLENAGERIQSATAELDRGAQ